ncbi:MAG: hypothetical protein Q8O15_04485, partial [Rectinemataceae bacterium]|nr:hypothetical protein [Rectinemataceae bacterium]
TFPCLCFDVDIMKSIDVREFIDISPIYSHSFSFFRAFHSSRCKFIPEPLVVFNHNEMAEEQAKLESRNRLFGRSAFFHASLGYVRHLGKISSSLNIPIRELAWFREDELDKNTKIVIPTLVGFFAFNFSIAQLNVELYASIDKSGNTIHISRVGIDELQDFFDSIDIPELGKYFRYARGIYCSVSIPQIEKTKEIFRIQMHACRLARLYASRVDEKYVGMPEIGLPFGARKILNNAIAKEGQL